MSEDNLNQKLEKLHEQGALTSEDLAKLKGARPEGTPAPEQKPHPDAKKNVWLRVALVAVLLSGAAKSIQLMQRTKERNALREKVQQQTPEPHWLAGQSGRVSKPAAPGGADAGPTAEQREKNKMYNRVLSGMTLAEVEAILGPAAETQSEEVRQPDRTTRRQVTAASWNWTKARPGLPKPMPERWLTVRFQDGKVKGKHQVRSK